MPSGVLGDVDLHRAGEGVRDDQRRGRQVVHLDVGVDPALEVAVAGEHRGDGQVVVVDRLGDLLRQRAGVADAGGAAVADEVEADLVEVRGQARLVEVVGDDLGARGEGGLDPRLAGQALLDGLLRDERGGDHDVRVRGVGAGGDRGDGDGAVVDLVRRAVGGGHGDRVRRDAVGGRPGRRRPGRTPCPPRRRRRRSCARPAANCCGGVRRGRCGPAGASGRRWRGRPWRGPAPASRRSPARRPGRARGPAPWRTPRRARPAGASRPVRRRYFRVSSSIGKIAAVEPNSGDMLPMVARFASGGGGDALTVELDELADDAVLAQHLGDGEHEVGGGGAGRAARRSA